jgi:hypothetical protein
MDEPGMTMFFFHYFDGEAHSSDDEGLEFESTERAYLEAVAAARAIWPELLAERRDPRKCHFLVADANGEELFRLEFCELLDDCRESTVRPGPSGQVLAALKDTHRRAATARADLGISFVHIYQWLGEGTALLARLSDFERPPPGKPDVRAPVG